jgi:hypothetical protein
MAIINRRNAILGWTVWTMTKALAKRKARQAAPGTGGHAGLNKGAIATILAAVVGAIVFWRLKADGEQTA